MLLGESNEIVAPKTTQQISDELAQQRLDAFSRMAIWGPIGIYGAVGKPIPTPLRFVMLGASLLQVFNGVKTLQELNNGNQY